MELQMKKIFKSLLVISALAFFSPQAAMAHGEDYATHAADKLGHGIANTATGIIELPKTMILTSQKEGILYGTTVGFLAGLVNVVARTGFGVLDVATFIIPTEPTVSPGYIWEDFSKETTYGK
jgi:putative exosortase-associated protein (TIGR04073 family)